MLPVPGPWLRHAVNLVLAVALVPLSLAIAVVAIPVLTLVSVCCSFTAAGRRYVQALWKAIFTHIETVVRELVSSREDDGKPKLEH